MAKRRVFFALFVAAGLTVSATSASAAQRRSGPLASMSTVTERVTVAETGGSLTSWVHFWGDRLVIAYRTFRGVGTPEGSTGGTQYHVDGIQDGPTGVDPLGVKGGGAGSYPPQTASTRVIGR